MKGGFAMRRNFLRHGVPSATAGGGGEETLTALEWSGNLSTTLERRLVWADPFPIYPATYLFKVFPREKTSGSNPRYYTIFFWGNNGVFDWDGGSANTYYGAHPYPQPAPNGPGQWEISVFANDFLTGEEVEWDRWFNQAFRARETAGNNFEHEFYWDYDAWVQNSNDGFLEQGFQFDDWAAENPPSPAIVVGQAPNNGSDQSWGGFAGYEEFNGRIRGMQFYSSYLTTTQIGLLLACETNAEVLSVVSGQGITSLYYLNMNPTVADVTDKSGNGNDPVWEGNDRPADFEL